MNQTMNLQLKRVMGEKFLALCFLLAIAALMSLLLSYHNLGQLADASNSEFNHTSYGILATYGIQIEQKKDGGLTSNSGSDPVSPKIAWLMSYPNSGTSYTMKLVGQASDRSTASNYGLECGFGVNGDNVPLYDTSPNGPYITHPDRELPKHYIITKTHCGGRCVECGPSSYIETKESFMGMCAKGAHVSSTNMTKVHVKYDPKLAQRAIHLIRNPFNNIVSNFHLEQHKNVKKNRHTWLKKYSNDAIGFRKWCNNIDAKYENEEKSSRLIPKSIANMFEGIPCHKSFYAFAQWHNLASSVIEDLQMPKLIIHYEDYEELQFNSTTRRIFEFLDVDPVGSIPPFVPGKDYTAFYTENERERAKQLVEELADPNTWRLVHRYF